MNLGLESLNLPKDEKKEENENIDIVSVMELVEKEKEEQRLFHVYENQKTMRDVLEKCDAGVIESIEPFDKMKAYLEEQEGRTLEGEELRTEMIKLMNQLVDTSTEGILRGFTNKIGEWFEKMSDNKKFKEAQKAIDVNRKQLDNMLKKSPAFDPNKIDEEIFNRMKVHTFLVATIQSKISASVKIISHIIDVGKSGKYDVDFIARELKNHGIRLNKQNLKFSEIEVGAYDAKTDLTATELGYNPKIFKSLAQEVSDGLSKVGDFMETIDKLRKDKREQLGERKLSEEDKEEIVNMHRLYKDVFEAIVKDTIRIGRVYVAMAEVIEKKAVKEDK